jgi:HAD superfamily, subfamily IIIB (Acid phosphatase)
MRRITLTLLAAAMLAVPAAASAQTPATGQTIPEPGPILTRLGHTPMVENFDGGGGLPYLGATLSYNAGDWENALRKYHDDGVYDKQVTKVDTVASKWIARAGRNHGSHKFTLRKRGHNRGVKVVRVSRHGNDHGHHNGNGKKKPALVLDIDETALSNYDAINTDNFTFGSASMAETTNETGKAIPATLALFNQAKTAGIAVFFITGRRETPDNRMHTEHNLTREGYSGWQQLFLRPAAASEPAGTTTTDYKSGTRAGIEKQGYRIIANVGDQYSDLAGGHEAVAFKLANPFYFLP